LREEQQNGFRKIRQKMQARGWEGPQDFAEAKEAAALAGQNIVPKALGMLLHDDLL
jgi:hypothetical protein